MPIPGAVQPFIGFSSLPTCRPKPKTTPPPPIRSSFVRSGAGCMLHCLLLGFLYVLHPSFPSLSLAAVDRRARAFESEGRLEIGIDFFPTSLLRSFFRSVRLFDVDRSLSFSGRVANRLLRALSRLFSLFPSLLRL